MTATTRASILRVGQSITTGVTMMTTTTLIMNLMMNSVNRVAEARASQEVVQSLQKLL